MQSKVTRGTSKSFSGPVDRSLATVWACGRLLAWMTAPQAASPHLLKPLFSAYPVPLRQATTPATARGRRQDSTAGS
eukprot:345650-Chlamydomonas_euryale.AAC.4